MTVLDVENLRVDFSGTSTVHAVNGVSFSVHRGECLGEVTLGHRVAPVRDDAEHDGERHQSAEHEPQARAR